MDHNWISHSAKLIEHASQTSLWQHLKDFLISQFEFQQMLVLLETNSGPQLIFEHCSSDLYDPALTDDYLERSYLLDPFYMAPFEANHKSDVFHLIDITPDGFYLSDYYKTQYAGAGLLDDLQYWNQVEQDLRITINFARSKESRFYSSQEVAQFKQLLPILNAAISAFWAARKNDFSPAGSGVIDMRQRLDSARKNFGRSVLTEREQQVVQTMLAGYSTKAAAQKLAISPETVHMHRKNIYTKLDISSQAEVFTLFLDSVAESDGSLDVDPLLAHQ